MRIQVFTRHETHNHPIQKKQKKHVSTTHQSNRGLGWFLRMWWIGFLHSYAFICFLFVAIFIWFWLYSVICNDRGTHKKFPRLFFINYVKDQGGKLRNLIKYIAKEIVSPILSVFCVKLVGGARAEKLGDWLPFSFQIRMKLLNLLRYFHHFLCHSC